MGALSEAYKLDDLDIFFTALKSFASTPYRKDIGSEFFDFFCDDKGKVPAKVLSYVNKNNIGNVLWSLSTICRRSREESAQKFREIALEYLAVLSRLGSIPPRPLSTALWSLAEMGVVWTQIPENDAVFINFQLWKATPYLDATGAANVFTSLSKFQRKWADLSPELQQVLLSRLAHKSHNAYSDHNFTFNCTHFSTVIYHMGLMGFKYNEAHVRVQSLIEEMICRVISTVKVENNLRHTEQALRTSLQGMAEVGVVFDKVRKLPTKDAITSILRLKLFAVSPYTFTNILES